MFRLMMRSEYYINKYELAIFHKKYFYETKLYSAVKYKPPLTLPPLTDISKYLLIFENQGNPYFLFWHFNFRYKIT